jgi:thiamine-phosphate pyrophosphorylase
MPIVQSANAAFIVNDRADLAKRLGADGVHIGQEDTPYAEARALMGPKGIVGVTCHDSRHLAMEAAEAGADYVAFGAFFETTTKQAKTKADPATLTWWQEMMNAPCVAIGGITPDNARGLAEAGADFLAVSSGVWDHPDGPDVAVKRLNDIFESLAR